MSFAAGMNPAFPVLMSAPAMGGPDASVVVGAVGGSTAPVETAPTLVAPPAAALPGAFAGTTMAAGLSSTQMAAELTTPAAAAGLTTTATAAGLTTAELPAGLTTTASSVATVSAPVSRAPSMAVLPPGVIPTGAMGIPAVSVVRGPVILPGTFVMGGMSVPVGPGVSGVLGSGSISTGLGGFGGLGEMGGFGGLGVGMLI